MFEKHGMKLLERSDFETPKRRLRPRDAKKYLERFCRNNRSFYPPDVHMRSHEEILIEFEGFIEKYGPRERRSKFILLIGKKSSF